MIQSKTSLHHFMSVSIIKLIKVNESFTKYKEIYWTFKKNIGASKGYINNVNKFYTDIGLFNLLLIYYSIEQTLIGNIITNKMMRYNQILVKHVQKICIFKLSKLF